MIKVYLQLCLVVLCCYSAQLLATSHIQKITVQQCQRMESLGVMSPEAPVQCQRLRKVQFNYVDFQGKHHNNGEMIVMDAVAANIATIFARLYKLGFPIHQARIISEYQGDDKRSMAANNSSAFNYRAITGDSGKRSLSMHAYGLAVDINPLQNPFIEFNDLGKANFSPAGGIRYANRMAHRLAKSNPQGFAEQVVNIFAENGFLYWGGFWDTPIDYQHFQVSREMANIMSAMNALDAEQFFNQYVAWYRRCKAMYPVAYSQHRVNDYVHYLKTELSVSSLSQHYQQAPQSVLSLIRAPFIRSEICVSR